MKGVVIIKLPPPESPSDGKTVAAAFAFANRDDPQDRETLPDHEDDEMTSPRIQQLPLHRGRAPRRRRSFHFLKSKGLGSFLFVCLIAYFLWQYSPSSLPLNDDSDGSDDSNSKKSERFMVYNIYSKMLVSPTLNSSLASQSIPAYPPASASFSNFSINKLVERDVVRNKKVDNGTVTGAEADDTSTAVFPLRGNVYPHGLYYVAVRIGSPPKQYFLDIDTGSDLTWLQCDAPCTSCAKGPHTLYRPRKMDLVDCKEGICSAVQTGGTFGCKDKSRQCDYEIAYADGGSSLGVLMKDKMALLLSNGSVVQTKIVFGCGYDQGGPLATSPAPTDGLLGLSTSRASLPSQLAEQGLVKNVIAHCITGSGRGGGYLFFGDKLLPLGISWAPMLGKPSAKNYVLAVQSIYLGDTLLTVDRKISGSVIFDSGTSYTYLVSPAYSALVASVSKNLIGSGLDLDDSDQTLPVCWHGISSFRSVEDVQHLFKTITLEFKGSGWFMHNRKMHISPEGYIIINSKGNVCLGVLDARALGSNSANIIGDISMQGHLIVYDNENNRMGWIKTDCRKLPSTATLSPSL